MKLGLIGKPLGHSYSALIHRMFGGEYFLKELEKEEVGNFLTSNGWDALNVTIPYKREVIPYCAELGEAARSIGSVNTLLRRTDGSIFGDNTDYAGFKALAERTGADFRGAKVLILGSGGTSLTARAVARDSGARDILVVSRTPSGEGHIGYDEVAEHLDADILINTTPVGMFPNERDIPVNPELFTQLKCVLDAVYNPLRTELVRRARACGIPASGGLYMLVAQAEAARRIFGAECARTCEEVYRELLNGRQNIALVGMPGSGKTTIGELIAAALGRELIDTDALVVEAAGMSIPDIFEREGEAGFRAREREAVAQACAARGAVIATGGGAVLADENRAALRRSCRVYHIERGVDALATDGRPLSTSVERLRGMKLEREPFYLDAADRTIENVIAADAAREIVRDFNENSCD